MRRRVATLTAVAALLSIVGPFIDRRDGSPLSGIRAAAASPAVSVTDDNLPWSHVDSRRQDDVAAMEKFRPGYAFWRSVFTIPDGAIAFGSAVDGRPFAVFPEKGDWTRAAKWSDPALASILDDVVLPRSLDDRRDFVAWRLEQAVGPVLHNPTRGLFVAPGVRQFGSFLAEWGAIYERFGVPAAIGLAQALIESGFVGTRRSEAGAIGLCQWLKGNWKYLDRLDPAVLEAHNQTTQAAYCGAYLSVLATKYGSFIPALSEHHAGGTNVGRLLVTGERLGAASPRERYLTGADLARDLRMIAPDDYGDIYGSYGPRSYRYAEMVFGNTGTVDDAMAKSPQTRIYAMRTPRAIPLAEIMRRTGLDADEIRRFNPALVKRVAAGATLYLPTYYKAFGRDVSFWRTPATATYTSVLNEFVRLDATPEQWDSPAFEPTLEDFARRFRATKSEDGAVMATVLTYVLNQSSTSGRREILSAFRASAVIRELFERGVRQRAAAAID
jgi:hypothetical protein